MPNTRSDVFTSADIAPPESKMQRFWKMLLSEDGACKQLFNGLFDISNTSRLTAGSTNTVSEGTGYRAFLPKYFGVFGLIYLLRFIYDFASILYETNNPKNLKDLEEKSFFARFKENLRDNEQRSSRMVSDFFIGTLNLICLIVDPLVALGLTIGGVVAEAAFELYSYIRDEQHFKEIEHLEAVQKSLLEERNKIAKALEEIKDKTRILKSEANKHLDELNNHLEKLKQKKVSLTDKNEIKKTIAEIKNEIKEFNHKHEKDLAKLKQNKFSQMVELKAKDAEIEETKQNIDSVRKTNHLPKRENKIAKRHLASLGLMLCFTVGAILTFSPPTFIPGIILLSAASAFGGGKILSGVWDFVADYAAKRKQNHNHPEKIEMEKLSTDAKLQKEMSKGNALQIQAQKLEQQQQGQKQKAQPKLEKQPKLEIRAGKRYSFNKPTYAQKNEKAADGLTMFQRQTKKPVKKDVNSNDLKVESRLAPISANLSLGVAWGVAQRNPGC